ncbi:OB-fold domain-containing protein [Nocardioides sp. BP30]|uniref:Zn-ribbon domain-containing OB-fold protein n=1 Tax=Nocardioides sp. BP30 TaxID=3036374 RepID=UPI0024695652|nr:OB-fold domain-containing protein [Nocardioides sp. BP30]WGL54076.1 OB-fold domain-containing protein [Nocardioides sp. BP30]
MTAVLTADWLLADTLAPQVEGDALAPLYEGAARGELVLPFCASCALPLDLDQQVCDGCDTAQIVWRAVEPFGVVHSLTVMHRREPGLVVANEPYPIIDVEVDGGHRLVMTTRVPPASLPRIGDRVKVAFRELGGVLIPSADLDPTTPSATEVCS